MSAARCKTVCHRMSNQVFSKITFQKFQNLSMMKQQFQSSNISPVFFSKTSPTFRAMDATSLSAPGYLFTAVTTFCWKVSKDSPFLEIFRSSFSAQPQTCSWGFRSGEYLGQSGKQEMLFSLKALLAIGLCRAFSPSSKI